MDGSFGNLSVVVSVYPAVVDDLKYPYGNDRSSYMFSKETSDRRLLEKSGNTFEVIR